MDKLIIKQRIFHLTSVQVIQRLIRHLLTTFPQSIELPSYNSSLPQRQHFPFPDPVTCCSMAYAEEPRGFTINTTMAVSTHSLMLISVCNYHGVHVAQQKCNAFHARKLAVTHNNNR